MPITKKSTFGDFLTDDVLRALEKGSNVFDGSQFRVVLGRKREPEPYWCAISLEMNVVATGYTQRKAIENLIALMAFHVADYIENGIEEDIYIPAPREIWQSFVHAQRIPKNRLPNLPIGGMDIQARSHGTLFATV